MKRLILSISLLLVSTAGVLAQTSAGTMSISGSGNYKEDRLKETSETEVYYQKSKYISKNLQISSSVGYFIMDNIEVGITGTASQYRSINHFERQDTSLIFNSYNSLGKTITNNYAVGPFVRKYFFLTERLALTATSNLIYAFSSARTTLEYTTSRGEEYENSSEGPKSNWLTVDLSAGVRYFASSKFSVNAGLGGIYYNRSSRKENKTTNEGISYVRKDMGNNGGISFSPQYINLGLSYYFGGN
ncbi:hypothetical protein ACMA1I_21430 [Pontibacter sp. 13R65]|uniref:hypothetical protein n=1 Tax=Pontibacter sp. 13R65 TaxID=3127458 RepID=UPI00301D6648